MGVSGGNGDGGSRRDCERVSRVEVFAPAKLNIALLVGPRRRDGFHEICSVMVPVSLADLVVAEVSAGGELTVDCEVCPGEHNLAARAARELEARAGRPLPAHLTILKRIPHAAGLGGGSSDAAAAMVALERLHALDFTSHVRYEVAAAVGSDVPFFLWRGPQLAMGRGTVLSALDLPCPLHFVIVAPETEMPTADVYRWRDEDTVAGLRDFAGRTQRLLSELRNTRRAEELATLVTNDLEPHVVRRRPEIARVRECLEEAGALAAAMSGSGAAVFGLFSDAEQAEAARARVVARLGIPFGRAFTVSDLQAGTSASEGRHTPARGGEPGSR